MPRTSTAVGAPAGKPLFVLAWVLVVVTAGLLRFHDLSGRSIWLDEAIAANNSRGTFSEVVANTRNQNSSPIVYPVILYAAQKVEESASAVRLPAAVASTLAVLVLLALPRVGVDRRVALLAGCMLAVSSTQIRYSQEVREYGLAVFLAAAMLYGFFSSLQSPERKSALLNATMLIAPLVQYGLVLFGGAILAALVLEGLRRQDSRAAIRGIASAALMLAAGGATSYVLTLRHQSRIPAGWWYLQGELYDGRIYDVPAVLAFLAGNTYRFLRFVSQGELALGLAIPAVGFMAYACARAPRQERSVSWPSLILAVISVGIVAAAAVVHVYPFGGTRQCLYLAPIVALVMAASFHAVEQAMAPHDRPVWFALALSLVLIAGAEDIFARMPYAEQEDIKSVMSALDRSARAEEKVYIYYNTRPALDFYGTRRPNFVFGTSHRGEPDGYVREFRELVGTDADRVWLVFSHAMLGEKDYILDHLKSEWDFEKRVEATGASLYLGVRRRIE